MKFNRHTNTVILWIVSVGLLLGMVIMFTPTLGRLGGRGGGGNSHGAVELEVNGQPIYQDAVARTRQNPLYNAVSQGEVGDDLQLLLVDNLVQGAVLAQASAKIHVSGGEVNKAVDDFRKSRGVAGRKNDQAYLNLIGNSGFTDPTFRQYVRESLRQQRWQSQLIKDVTVSDAEVKAWYQTHRDSYRSEPQIKAREIVVDDAKQAVELQKQAVAGADFAALAKKYSKELADRGGALGAAKGQTTPQPVGKPALPTAVADAAFGLKGPGITDVVSAAGLYYIVQVEAYLPATPEPFAKVENQVKADALKAKQAGVLQQKIEQLVREAKVTVPQGSSLSYRNPVVAKVGDATITAAELDRATYTNPQIQRALSPQSASLVTQFFKPAVLGQLIDTYVAAQGAKTLGLPLVGTRQMVAQAAMSYVSRDAKATPDALRKYYQDNKTAFVVPAEAAATRVEFARKSEAEAFRQALLQGQALDAAAKSNSGTVKNLGTVRPGQLPTELDTVLFRTNAFTPVPKGKQGISDVLVLAQPVKSSGPKDASGAATPPAAASSSPSSSGGVSTKNTPGDAGSTAAPPKTKDTYVVLLATRTPQRTRSFSQVQEEVRAAVLANRQQQLRLAWLDKVRKQIKVQDMLSQLRQKPKPSAGSSSGGATSGSGSSAGAPAAGSSSPAASGSGAAGSGPAGSGAAGSGAAGSGASGSGAAGSGPSGSGSSSSPSKSGN